MPHVGQKSVASCMLDTPALEMRISHRRSFLDFYQNKCVSMEGREKEFTISLVFLDTAFLKEIKPYSYFMLQR